MPGYTRKSFDRCLVAIISELGELERNHPNWPDSVVDAARIIADQAERLLSASAGLCYGSRDEVDRILKEAIRTGATVLGFLLNIDERLSYETVPINERKTFHPGIDD